MLEASAVALRERTTLRTGGPARRLVEVTSRAEIGEAMDEATRAGDPLLLLGDGSNLVVADSGFPGTVVALESRGVDVAVDGEHVLITVEAGEPWDALVERCVDEGWSGVEALSGIPGRAGATPVQNVGAYGQEVGQVLEAVTVHDRDAGASAVLSAADCGLGYRTSRFKGSDRFVVTSVTLRLDRSTMSAPVAYGELARTLGTEVGRRVPAAAVRAAVLGLRRSKGMVLDGSDRDTWSVGSFFTNPVLSTGDAERLSPDAPRYAQRDGRVKVPAAWLIERAGFPRGYGHGPARISSKHSLALTNRGDATTAEVVALAREIRDGVGRVHGINLEVEPRLVGVAL